MSAGMAYVTFHININISATDLVSSGIRHIWCQVVQSFSEPCPSNIIIYNVSFPSAINNFNGVELSPLYIGYQTWLGKRLLTSGDQVISV